MRLACSRAQPRIHKSSASVPNDILRVDLIVPKHHKLVVCLSPPVRDACLCKDGIVWRSRCCCIVDRSTSISMCDRSLVHRSHCDPAVKYAVLTLGICLRGVLVCFTECVGEVRASAIQPTQRGDTLVETTGGDDVSHRRVLAHTKH